MGSTTEIHLPGSAVRQVSRGRLWTGWGITGLIMALMLMDAAMKFSLPAGAAAAIARSGWPIQLASTLGVIVLVCTVLYVVPRTAVLGAILLTGYLGGAVATNLRLENPLFTGTLFPVYFGVLVWGALWLRDPRVAALIPLRQRRQGSSF